MIKLAKKKDPKNVKIDQSVIEDDIIDLKSHKDTKQKIDDDKKTNIKKQSIGNKIKESETYDSIKTTVRTNGTLLTFLSICFIIIVGLTITNNVSNWWITGLLLIAIGVIIFLFFNVKTVIKSAISLILLVLFSSEAFRMGFTVDKNDGSGGVLWMTTILFIYFALASYSYLTSSGASRWATLTSSMILGFVATLSLSITDILSITPAILIGALINIITFLFFYRFTRKTKFKNDGMPKNIFTQEYEERVLEAAQEAGWNATVIRPPLKKNKKNKEKFNKVNKELSQQGKILIWDKRAYLLYPIDMDRQFAEIGNRRSKLGYYTKNINPWLLKLSYSEVPVWKAKGANINVVLLDVNNGNGSKSKIIGTSLPDTKKKLPIGIIPSKIIKQKITKDSKKDAHITKIADLIDNIDEEMIPYTQNLTEKQKEALSKINKPVEKDKKKTIEKESK